MQAAVKAFCDAADRLIGATGSQTLDEALRAVKELELTTGEPRSLSETVADLQKVEAEEGSDAAAAFAERTIARRRAAARALEASMDLSRAVMKLLQSTGADTLGEVVESTGLVARYGTRWLTLTL
jgi:hypothetical protein